MRLVRTMVGAVVAVLGGFALTLVVPAPAGAGGAQQVTLLADPLGAGDDLDDWTVPAAEVRAGYQPSPTVSPTPAREPVAAPASEAEVAPATTAPTVKPRASIEESPAGRAGTDPPGGLPGEVVAWLIGLGLLIVVWCLAWRWRPQETRMVVRQGDRRRPAPEPANPADVEPEPVHIEL